MGEGKHDGQIHQVFIARKFYNDVAGRTLDARRRPLARVLRLSGSATQPEFWLVRFRPEADR